MWGVAAIGNAKWGGVLLSDVLKVRSMPPILFLSNTQHIIFHYIQYNTIQPILLYCVEIQSTVQHNGSQSNWIEAHRVLGR